MTGSRASQPMRIPIKIDESYAAQGQELTLFPKCPSYLTRAEVTEAWPTGIITHESFTHRGFNWRMHSGRAGGPNSPLQWLAVLDGEASSGYPRRALSTSEAVGISQRSPMSPCSRPLVDLDIDSSPNVMQPFPLSAASSPNSNTGHWLNHQMTTQMRHSGLALAVSQSQSQNKFIEDLLAAESSQNAMERYKALIRLMSALKRRIAQARITHPHKASSWDSQEHQDVLKQIVMVGECLARFGTAEFSERSNSSRAINTKDYATLLTQFLEAHGAIFAMEFIVQLSQVIQDEVLTVRSLLQTRCEANSIIFAQLIKHVGTEGQGNGQAVVYNNNVVAANPTSIASATPKTLVQVAANAWAKASEKRSSRMGMIAAAAVFGLLVLKRGVFGGGGRRGGRGRHGSSGESELYEETGRRRRGGGYTGGALGLAERMLEARTSTERNAVAQVMACNEELMRAQHNIELLTHDWRMGQLRMGGGTHPPGFQPLDLQRCSLSGYLHRLDDPYWQPAAPQYAPRAQHAMLPAPPVQVPLVVVESSTGPTAEVVLAPAASSKRQQDKRQDKKRVIVKTAAVIDSPAGSDGGSSQARVVVPEMPAALAAIPAALAGIPATITDMLKL